MSLLEFGRIGGGQWLTALLSTGEVARSAPERQSARFPHRGQQADDGSDEEDESSEDEDDGEEKAPVYHHEIWKKLVRKGRMGGLLRYGLLLWSLLENSG